MTKIIINIPDDIYEDIKDNIIPDYDDLLILVDCIDNGIIDEKVADKCQN